jgi:hypothetical protein
MILQNPAVLNAEYFIHIDQYGDAGEVEECDL